MSRLDLVALDAHDFLSAFAEGRNYFNSHQEALPKKKGTSQYAPLRPLSEFRVVLFVSHRWESQRFPDMKNSQAIRLRDLLNTLSDFKPNQILNGIYFDKVSQGSYSILDWARACQGKPKTEFLHGIGLWYDDCCLPQSLKADSDETLPRDYVLNQIVDIIAQSNVFCFNGDPAYDLSLIHI